jgi:YD repeat-containing protein
MGPVWPRSRRTTPKTAIQDAEPSQAGGVVFFSFRLAAFSARASECIARLWWGRDLRSLAARSFGEVLTTTDPLGNVTTNTYDGNASRLHRRGGKVLKNYQTR